MRFYFQLTLFSTAFATLYSNLICLPIDKPGERRITGINIKPKENGSLLVYYHSDVSKTNIPDDKYESVFDDSFVDKDGGSSSIGLRYCTEKLLEYGLCQLDQGFLVDFKGHQDIKERTINTVLTENEDFFFEVEERGTICILSTSHDRYSLGVMMTYTHAKEFSSRQLRIKLRAIQMSSILSLFLTVCFILKTKLYKLKTSEITHLPKTLIYWIIVNFLSLQISHITLLLLNHRLISNSCLIALKHFDKYFIIFLDLGFYQYSINNSTWNETVKDLRWNKFKKTSIIFLSIGLLSFIKEIWLRDIRFNEISLIIDIFVSGTPIYNFYWLKHDSKNLKKTVKVSNDSKLDKRLRITSFLFLSTTNILQFLSYFLIFVSVSFYLIDTTATDLNNYLENADILIDEIPDLVNGFTFALVSNLEQFKTPFTISLLLLIWRNDINPPNLKIN